MKNNAAKLDISPPITPTPIHRINTTVDPANTVMISNVTCIDFVKDSRQIIKQFKKHFGEIEVQTYFLSKGGSVLIELSSTMDAEEVCSKWESTFFSKEGTRDNSKLSQKGTSCQILKNANRSVLIKKVPLDIDTDNLKDFLSEAYSYKISSVLRFKTRAGNLLQTIKIDFETVADQEKCLKEGIKYQHQSFLVEKYQIRKRVIQCYNCWRFNHIANLCPNRTVCLMCSGNHHSNRCEQGTERNGYKTYRCTNCNGNHFANDRKCKVYSGMEHKLTESNKMVDIYRDY